MDVAAVTDDAAAAASGVAHAAALLGLADAAVRGDEAAVAAARQRLLDELGPEAFVDAAAVIANFERMTRIADATGIPLDTPVAALTEDLRDALAVEAFGSARNTPPLGTAARWLGRVARPLSLQVFRVLGFGARSKP